MTGEEKASVAIISSGSNHKIGPLYRKVLQTVKTLTINLFG